MSENILQNSMRILGLTSSRRPTPSLSLLQSASTAEPPTKPLCYVTVGATSTFPSLIHSVLQPSTIRVLSELGFGTLQIQYGSDADTDTDGALKSANGKDHNGNPRTGSKSPTSPKRRKKPREVLTPTESWYKSLIGAANHDLQEYERELRVRAQRFYPPMNEVLRTSAPALDTGRPHAVVITHAGSGTILECLRLAVPTIAIPNPALADNHQAELATELDRMGYVILGDPDNLKPALEKAVALFDKPLTGPGTSQLEAGSIARVVDEEMGYLD